jgi:autotransporter-associated beta strand protein
VRLHRGPVKNPRLGTLVIVFSFLVAATLCGAEYTWSGGARGVGDDWRLGNNWRPSPGKGGPGPGDIAVFSTKGTSAAIGINFNDGLGLETSVAAAVLTEGPDRTIFNSSPKTPGMLRLEGWDGVLLANHAEASWLTLQGGMENAMMVELAGRGEIQVRSAMAGIAIDGELAGSHGLIKTGDGLLRLTRSNSLRGEIVVSGGSLELAGATGGTLGSIASLRIESGALANLSAPRQIAEGASLELAGGTLRGGKGTKGAEERLGPLTLTADSRIDLGGSDFFFTASSGMTWAPTASLTIGDWGGVADGRAGRLFFGPGGLTSDQLAQIYFGDLGIRGGQLVGPHGELRPVPEAPTASAAALLVGLIVWRERRRLMRALRHRLAARSGASVSRADRYRSVD